MIGALWSIASLHRRKASANWEPQEVNLTSLLHRNRKLCVEWCLKLFAQINFDYTSSGLRSIINQRNGIIFTGSNRQRHSKDENGGLTLSNRQKQREPVSIIKEVSSGICSRFQTLFSNFSAWSQLAICRNAIDNLPIPQSCFNIAGKVAHVISQNSYVNRSSQLCAFHQNFRLSIQITNESFRSTIIRKDDKIYGLPELFEVLAISSATNTLGNIVENMTAQRLPGAVDHWLANIFFSLFDEFLRKLWVKLTQVIWSQDFKRVTIWNRLVTVRNVSFRHASCGVRNIGPDNSILNRSKPVFWLDR